MKSKVLVVISSVIFLGGVLPAAEEAPKRVGLQDAKNYAIQHNHEVHAAQNALDEADAKLGRARAPFFPQVGVAAGGDTEISSGTTQGAPIGYLYGNYNLFNGFGDYYQVQMASLEAEKAQIRLKQTKFRVGLDVEKVFHLYLFKKISMELKQKAIKVNEAHRKMAAQKRSAGMASESDIIEFDLKEALLKSDLLLLSQELEEARSGLKRLLGEEIGSKIEPYGDLQHQHLSGTLMEYMKKIKDESEGVVLAAKDVAISSLQAKKSNSAWLPKVDFEIAAGYLPWDLRTVASGTSMIGGKIVARFDLFSGFDTAYERKESFSRQLRTENELKHAILTAITATENAYRRIATIQNRVDLEQQNEQRAERYYKAVLSDYRRGVKQSDDLRAAADVLYETSLKQENFKFDFLSQRIELEQALGVPVPTEVIDESKHHQEHKH